MEIFADLLLSLTLLKDSSFLTNPVVATFDGHILTALDQTVYAFTMTDLKAMQRIILILHMDKTTRSIWYDYISLLIRMAKKKGL